MLKYIIYYSKIDRDHFLSIKIYIVNVQYMAEFAPRILHIVLSSNSYALQYSRKCTLCTFCLLTHAPSKSCVTLDTNWHIKIVNFHLLTVKRIWFDLWPLKMPRRQFRNRLSTDEINRGVGMLESGVFQRCTLLGFLMCHRVWYSECGIVI